jgi:hypothetical protein
MRTLLTIAAVLAAAIPAEAISRYNSDSLSCAETQARVSDEGAVILRYRSTRNPSLTLYDRYVADGRFCGFREYARLATVPTADRGACRVLVCKPVEYDDHFD